MLPSSDVFYVFHRKRHRRRRTGEACPVRRRDGEVARAPRGEAQEGGTRMKLLEGDSALVTGTGNGIGRAIAKALEDEGARVLRADLAGADVNVDLSKNENAKALAEEAIRRLGTVSIFVHSASPRRQEAQTVLGASYEQWREMLSVNLDAAFCISQIISKHMIERRIKGRMLL